MPGAHLPTFNPLDAVNSALEDLAKAITDATTSMFATVMDWSVNQGASVDWSAPYLGSSAVFAFTLSFMVGLPVLLLLHVGSVKAKRASEAELWDVLLWRLPRWLLVSMFGLAAGVVLSHLVRELNRSIVDYMFGSSADEAAESFKNVLLQGMLGSGLPLFLVLVLGLVIFLSSLAMFLVSILLTIASQFLAVLIPLGTLPDLTRRHRGLTRKFVMVFLAVMLAMPLQLFIFGYFFKVVSYSLDAGTVPGMIQTTTSGNSPMASMGLLAVGSLVMLAPLLGPFALLRWLGQAQSMVTGGGGSGGGSGSTGTSGPGSPQEASMGSGPGGDSSPSRALPAGGGAGVEVGGGSTGGAGTASPGGSSGGGSSAGVSGGGTGAGAVAATPSAAAAGGGAGAAGGGAGAAGGGAAAGAAGSAGTAAAAVGAGAATAGVGAVVVAGLSAAGRMAHGANSAVKTRTNQTAQNVSMASMHLDGGGDE